MNCNEYETVMIAILIGRDNDAMIYNTYDICNKIIIYNFIIMKCNKYETVMV